MCLEETVGWGFLPAHFTQLGMPPSLQWTLFAGIFRNLLSLPVGTRSFCLTWYVQNESDMPLYDFGYFYKKISFFLSEGFLQLHSVKGKGLDCCNWSGCRGMRKSPFFSACPEVGQASPPAVLHYVLLCCAAFFVSKGEVVHSSAHTDTPFTPPCVIGESNEHCFKACCVWVKGQSWPAKRSQGPYPVCNQARSTPRWPHASVCAHRPASAHLGCLRSNRAAVPLALCYQPGCLITSTRRAKQ